MLNTWGMIQFDQDPIRKLRKVIQTVSFLNLLIKFLLEFFIDPCFFFATFQVF